MNKKNLIKATLVIGFFLTALGGWLLHARIHPPSGNPVNLVPFISGLASAIIITTLFCFRNTVFLGYLLNGFLCIIGTIAMAHFSAADLHPRLTVLNLLLTTTLPDIAILWGKFCLGKAVFDLETLKSNNMTTVRGRFWRWPNMGWWWVHLAGLSTVYAAGHLLWR